MLKVNNFYDEVKELILTFLGFEDCDIYTILYKVQQNVLGTDFDSLIIQTRIGYFE